jgi:plastocyanin
MAHVALLGLSLVLALGACGGDDTDTTAAPPSTTSTVSAVPAATASSGQPSGAGGGAIAGFTFMPSPVTVPPGGTVTWTNDDDAAHSISDTSPMAAPQSKSLNKGDTFSITYPRPGTYPYVCGIHNYMQGSVEVKS